MLFATVFLRAQSGILSGYVLDAQSLEPLPYASVSLDDGRTGAYADEYGFFRLNFPAAAAGQDTVWIRAGYVGYASLRYPVTGEARQELRLLLTAASNLPTIEVRAPAGRLSGGSLIVPSLRTLDAVPQLAGEKDYLKALTLLPGISTSIEGTANLQIRGGSSDQTLLLIDGNPVYNANHGGGFLSALPPYGVKTLKIYKGGAPPVYGGRLSGVVDILLKEGDRRKWRGEGSLGTATLRAAAEGPLSENSSLLLAGRYGYPSLILDLLQSGNYKRGRRGNKTNLYAYDWLGKYSLDRGKTKFFVSTFAAGDHGFVQEAYEPYVHTEQINWTSWATSAYLHHTFSPRLQFKGALMHSRYQYRYRYEEDFWEEEQDRTVSGSGRQARIADWSARADLSYLLSTHQTLSMGAQFIWHTMRTRIKDLANGQAAEFTRLDEAAGRADTAFYAQYELSAWQERLLFRSGVRLSDLRGRGYAASVFAEPRFGLSVALLKNLSINLGYDRQSQYLHQLQTGAGAFPNDLWVMANAAAPPARSRQWFGGFSGKIGENTEWSVEAFRKELTDLVMLRLDRVQYFGFNQTWEKEIYTQGTGDVEGLECYIANTEGRLQYALAYTRSRSRRRFSQVNEGAYFPFTFDRPHDLSVFLSYPLGKKWTASANWIYQSGHAVLLHLPLDQQQPDAGLPPRRPEPDQDLDAEIPVRPHQNADVYLLQPVQPPQPLRHRAPAPNRIQYGSRHRPGYGCFLPGCDPTFSFSVRAEFQLYDSIWGRLIV
jgi:outer membrane cobalamin receptor